MRYIYNDILPRKKSLGISLPPLVVAVRPYLAPGWKSSDRYRIVHVCFLGGRTAPIHTATDGAVSDIALLAQRRVRHRFWLNHR